jgi:hypothetical protein
MRQLKLHAEPQKPKSMEQVDYKKLQDELRQTWEQLEYAHLWLTASDWTDETNIDDKLTTAQVRARAYLEIVDRLAWTMRRS